LSLLPVFIYMEKNFFNKTIIPVFTLSVLLLTGCALQPANTISTPLPQAALTDKPAIQPSPLATPHPSPASTLVPYILPDIKRTFRIEPFSTSPGFKLAMYIDSVGNGLIFTESSFLRVKNFRVENEINKNLPVYGGPASVSLDKAGNGLIVMGSGIYGCAEDCRLYGSVTGKKIENYNPVGEIFVIDEGDFLYNTTPVLKLDEDGNGFLYYTGNDNKNLYFQEVKKFKASGDRKEYSENTKNLFDSLGKYVDKDGNGAIITNENGNIVFRKIEDNQIIDSPVILSLNNISDFLQVSLNKNGDGLAIWSGKICTSCLGATVYARYIKNFNPQ
jgi:hypothetical protein